MSVQKRLDIERFVGFQTAIEEAAKRFGFDIQRVEVDEQRQDWRVDITISAQQTDAPKLALTDGQK